MQKFIKLCLTLSVVLVFNQFAIAKQAALSPSQVHSIASSKDWLHLVQYTPRLMGRIRSEMPSGASFLASEGQTNPSAELIATIDALAAPLETDQIDDDHPRCRFIARYEFLKTQVDFPAYVESIKCAKFEQWVRVSDVESVSLIFASGYFKNPASFYGHPLLKLNGSKPNSAGLLDITINNGAIVPDNENPVLYMIRGIFGGYQAAFSDTTFYQLNHSYSENDLRDLWDYELNLSEEQIKRVIYYSWELLNQRFTYRFFSNNCGYFLEDLLQYALGKRISPRNRIYAVPSNTFFNAAEFINNNQALIKRISRAPSRHSKFNESYQNLDKDSQNQVHYFVANDRFASQLSREKQIPVIDTLTDYYSFLIAKADDEELERSYKIKRSRLYAKRLQFGHDKLHSDHTSSRSWLNSSRSTPPHTGSRPSLTRISYLYNSELGDGFRFRLRPVSYDLLDLDEGHIPNSTLNMFNIEASSLDGQIRLSRFDLVDIKTLNISRTGLPGDGGLGWGLRLGLERANNSCLDCLLGQVSVSAIKARELNKRLSVYFQAEGTFHSSYLDGSFRGQTSFSVVAQPFNMWKSELTVGKRFSIHGDSGNETVFRWQNRIGDQANRNIRIDVSYDGVTEANIGYGWYW